MSRTLRSLAACFAVLGLVAAGGSAFAQSPHQGNGQGPKQHGNPSASKGEKQHKNFSGKDLVGDKIHKDGSYKMHQHDKFTASVNVSGGKISGMHVKHSERGDIPVTKYKTTKNMAQGPTNGIQLVSYVFAQDQFIGTVWIGYAYTDDWGVEVIYWFPYDMIFDGDTGAIEYYPAY
jgi:hypothetical protein